MTKDSIINDLEELAIILNGIAEICDDVQPLYDAAQLCRQNSNNTDYQYDLSRLYFKLPWKPGHLIPHDADDTIKIEFRIVIEGKYHEVDQIKDPISALQLNILIFGQKGGDELFSSWHLDYHDWPEESDNSHPKFHFTFGGTEMYQERSTMDFGQTIILPTPRISHPPMDAILGIDFILKNYFDREILSDVFANSRYKRIIKNAQKRLWWPYIMSASSYFNKHENLTYHDNLIPTMIFPDLQ